MNRTPFDRAVLRQQLAAHRDAQIRGLQMRKLEVKRQIAELQKLEETRDTILRETVKRAEVTVIKRALQLANGSVTAAAPLLGMTHQGLAYKIEFQHRQELGHLRAPRKTRRSRKDRQQEASQ